MRFEDHFGERERLHSLSFEVGVPFVDLDRVKIEPAAKDCVSTELMRQFQCVVVKREGTVLWVAFGTTDWQEGLDSIAQVTQCLVLPVLAVPDEIRAYLDRVD